MTTLTPTSNQGPGLTGAAPGTLPDEVWLDRLAAEAVTALYGAHAPLAAPAQAPGGPSIPAGAGLGRAAAPGLDPASAPGAATAPVESLASALDLPSAPAGIAPVLAPFAPPASALGGPSPAVPGGPAPGLTTLPPDVLTPRSYGLPGEEDLKRLLAGVGDRPPPAPEGLPGSGASRFYFLGPHTAGVGTKVP